MGSVVLRIVERQLKLQGVEVDPPPGFLDPRVETFGIAVIIKPRSFVKTNRIALSDVANCPTS